MRSYERSGLIIAAGLSIAVHSSALVYFAQYGAQQVREQSAPASVLQISMLRPAQPRPVRAAPVSDPVPRRLIRSVPAVPPSAPVLQPAPVSDRVPRTAPVPAATDNPQESPLAKSVAVAGIEREIPVQQPLPAARLNVQESYLQQLLAHIDSHKFYPRSARRRGLEGEIEVSFTLLENGNIRDLQVRGGSRILRKAAERAVLSAQPMPAPPDTMKRRDSVSFGMLFRLG